MARVRRIDVPLLLRHLGILAESTRGGWRAICPSPAHVDRDPSWRIVDRPGQPSHGSHHCFSCKFGGGPWELAAAVWGVSVADAGEHLRELGIGDGKLPAAQAVSLKVALPADSRQFALPAGVVIPGPAGRWFPGALGYLAGRGVTREQCDRWGFGYALRGRLRLRVVMPVYTEGYLRTFSARSWDPGDVRRYDSGREADGAQPRRAVWGESRWDRARGVVTIAEGIFSALALERAGFPNVSALLGSQVTSERARVLSGWGHYVIATDPDSAGDRVARWLAQERRRARVTRVRLSASPDDAPADELRAACASALRQTRI